MNPEGYVHAFEVDADHSLHIYQGSLARVQADALVSSDDNYLSAGGGVSFALARAAGFDVKRERNEIARGEHRPTLGDVVRTSGGGLPCRYIYHAITIDFDRCTYLDEASLRKLVANLLRRASDDGVRSIGMPALGTGAASFELGRASEIIIDELLIRLVDTPIRRVTLALMGDEAERFFYERIVRSRANRLASIDLRRRESTTLGAADDPHRAGRELLEETEPIDPVERSAPPGDPGTPPGPAGLEREDSPTVDEIVEQFPKLIDDARLASTPPDRPRLVEGLSDLILRHAEPDDIERELLGSPACRGFRGTLKQRLMEFLYLSEDNLRMALGPALFKNKDLRQMVKELGEDGDLPQDQDQLLVVILPALCFNTLAPPVGIGEYIARLERLLADLRTGVCEDRNLIGAAIEAGKILEQALKDLLRTHGFSFFGADFEAELVNRKIIATRRDGNHVSRLTIGQALEALEQLNSQMKHDTHLEAKWRSLGVSGDDLLPRQFGADQIGRTLESRQVLREIIATRNESAHTGGADATPEPDDLVQKIQKLHAFFCACQASGVYPDVLRYEGTYENRNGERFVYFLDEKGRDRKVRTDEKIDARRHYYCFATNNPIHLHPTLIPKL